MFEIGSSLREARLRRGLELSQVERDTHIRGRYLTAMEEDEFDVLPGPAYAKGFLRSYAEYLGLDAQQFVDEFNTRFAPEEEPAGAPPVRVQRRRGFGRRIVVAPAVVVLALLGWGIANGVGQHGGKSPPSTRAQTSTRPVTITRAAVATRPTPARLVVTATRGPCWLLVRRGSATGALVYNNTLAQGQSVRFVSVRLWIRFGAPWNVDAKVNGRALSLPTTTGNLVVSASSSAR